MSAALRLEQQQRLSLRQLPRLASRLLALDQLGLATELATLAQANPLLELDDSGGAGFAPQPQQTLAEHLAVQLEQTPMAKKTRADALRCLSCLDERGYLPAAAPLARQAGLTPARAAAAAQAIRQLSPAGVGARDLADCLLLQLAAITPATAAVQAARNLVANHFDALARRRHELLPQASLEPALQVIRGLQPRFANDFAATALTALPDLEAVRTRGLWHARLPDQTPAVRLRPDAPAAAGTSGTWRQAASQARAIVGALRFRRATLLAVGQALVGRQRGYFERGPRALVPVRLQDLAGDTQLSVSTVSATLQGKSIAAPGGAVALKFLLQRDACGRSHLAATALQEMIKEYIASEEPSCPLSDNDIMQLLHDQGHLLARRTVAKHRQLAGALAASLRRRSL